MKIRLVLTAFACVLAFIAGGHGGHAVEMPDRTSTGADRAVTPLETHRPERSAGQDGDTAAAVPMPSRSQGRSSRGETIQVRTIGNSIWFVDPAGSPFITLGVNAVRRSRVASQETDSMDPNLRRFADWGFNTLGAWSDNFHGNDYPYTVVLDLAPEGPIATKLDRVFTDDFLAAVHRQAGTIRSYRDDPLLLGYFLDNELPWWGDTGWRDDGKRTLLEKYALAETNDANKDALVEFMRERYLTPERFEAVWQLGLSSFDALRGSVPLVVSTRAQRADAHAWAGLVARRYFEVTASFVRSLDPDHLILGVRFAGAPIWEVVDECARVSDVISINHYSPSGNVDRQLLDNLYARTGKPVLISEYSFRATRNRSGNPNTQGPEVTVATQADRAEHATRYMQQALRLPYIVGAHWFSWEDQPPQGRADGEDSNVGLLDIYGEPYLPLVEAQRRINAEAESIHANEPTGFPDGFRLPDPVTYRTSAERQPLPRYRQFVDFSRRAGFGSWAHTGYGGSARAVQSCGRLTLRVETGTGWGGGVSIAPNVEPLLAAGKAIDLVGYDAIEIMAKASRGLRFWVYLTESGAGPPHAPPQAGLADADGESYALPMLTGEDAWMVYRLPLTEIVARTNWGNQDGNRVLDLQAIESIDLHVGGAQGDGVLSIRQINFVRDDQ